MRKEERKIQNPKFSTITPIKLSLQEQRKHHYQIRMNIKEMDFGSNVRWGEKIGKIKENVLPQTNKNIHQTKKSRRQRGLMMYGEAVLDNNRRGDERLL